jgi:iron complex outermembrane receptor protein
MAQSWFSVLEELNLKTGIVIENLWNTSYRDYLNRMRFYADDLGRNWLVYVQLNF